jgi:hypothetical protein
MSPFEKYSILMEEKDELFEDAVAMIFPFA